VIRAMCPACFFGGTTRYKKQGKQDYEYVNAQFQEAKIDPYN